MIKIATLLWMLLLCCAVHSQSKPNIVFFIADDAGYYDNSVYGNGEVKTPNLEVLAHEGMRFTNAFVASPACAPSRAALLTGLMPSRNGAEANHTYPAADIPVLTRMLQNAGYHVIAFGKVGHDKMNTTAGFDFYSQPRENLANNIRKYFAANTTSKPVCLLVGDKRPHVPWTKQATYDPSTVTLPPKTLDTKETRAEFVRYLTDMTGMDKEVGEVMQIAREKFGDNHLFLFSSDHGAQWPFGKWNLYDASIRTPLFIKWPGHIAPNSVHTGMVSWVDIFPTLLDVAGIKVSDTLDGRSIANVFSERGIKRGRDVLYTTHSGDGEMNVYPMRSMRNQKYKLILNLHPEFIHTNHSDILQKDGAGSFWDSWYSRAKTDAAARALVEEYHHRPAVELFDLQTDPHELHNLAGKKRYRKIAARMQTKLRAWMKAQGDEEKVYNTPRLKCPLDHN